MRKLRDVFGNRVVIAELFPLRQDHDCHRRKLFCNGANVRGSFRSETRACLKVSFSERVPVNDFSLFGNKNGAIELASFIHG